MQKTYIPTDSNYKLSNNVKDVNNVAQVAYTRLESTILLKCIVRVCEKCCDMIGDLMKEQMFYGNCWLKNKNKTETITEVLIVYH